MNEEVTIRSRFKERERTLNAAIDFIDSIGRSEDFEEFLNGLTND